MLYQNVLQAPHTYDLDVKKLGTCKLESPHHRSHFVEDHERTVLSCDVDELTHASTQLKGKLPSFEKAGPRGKIFHDPSWSRAAIVTCGGLCPGLNDVIKSLVQTLYYGYGVQNIFGIRYGYRGFIPKFGLEPIMLTPDIVDTIHEQGGTILGSSRGQQETPEIVDTLERMNINMLFCIGGDGTLRAANEIAEEALARNLGISVIGIPKTIDNDLNFIGRSFGFETAVYKTSEIIQSAHMEAKGAYNGIGLVKLMGRDSGFITAFASVANSVVNFCLIPESPFELDGENGLLAALERRFKLGKTHCVIAVAEGAGQDLIKGLPEHKDASGNILKHDIGLYLQQRIKKHFKKLEQEVSLKYFDPSYSIRSVAAQGTDAILCCLLAQNAVHAAMSGCTDCVIGNLNNQYAFFFNQLFPAFFLVSLDETLKPFIDGAGWFSVKYLSCGYGTLEKTSASLT